MASPKPTTVTRQRLHQLVWRHPLNKVAVDLKTTGTKLGAICDEYQVVRPRQGHWTRLALGQVMEPTPLSDALSADLEITIPQWQVRKRLPREYPVPKLEVPQPVAIQRPERAPDEPHEFFVRQAAWLKRQRSLYHRDGEKPEPDEPLLSSRGLRVINALYLALEARGHKIQYELGFHWQVRPVIEEEPLTLDAAKIVRQRRRPLTTEERNDPNIPSNRRWRHVYEPTDVMRVRASTVYRGCASAKWEDSPEGLIEDRLDEIVTGLEGIAHQARLLRQKDDRERHQRMEKERREAEADRLWEEDQNRWDKFRQAAADWREADTLRDFIAALEKKVADNPDQARGAAKWIAWAREHTYQLDPLSRSAQDVFRLMRKPVGRSEEFDDY